MATLYISEYSQVASVNTPSGPSQAIGQAPQEPPLAEQIVNIAASSTPSSPFGRATTMVRLHTDAICSVSFGASPTATTTNKRMGAGQTEYFGVVPGYSVAVVANV